MSDTKHDGGPAFPGSADSQEGHMMREYGMSLRDWFAGQALATVNNETVYTTSMSADDVASMAYAYADAMLAARERK